MTVTETIKELEDKYVISIEDFLDLYKRSMSRGEIATRLNISEFRVRFIASSLRLPWKKSKRGKALLHLQVATTVESSSIDSAAAELEAANSYLTDKLKVATKALQRSRDEARVLRAMMREGSREEAMLEDILKIIEPVKPDFNKVLHVDMKHPSSSEQIDCLLLSDIHADELVEKSEVGDQNSYSYEVMEERLYTLFEAFISNYSGADRGIVACAGDFITGIIHNALEGSSKHPVEVLELLSTFIAEYIASMSLIYTTIDVVVVNGNHGRLTNNIKSKNKGFDFEYLFGQLLKAKCAKLENVTIEVSTTGYAVIKLKEAYVGVHHGDHFRGTHSEGRCLKVIEAFKSVCSVEVKHIMQGHTHNFSHHNTPNGSYITNGSVIGSNSYGVTNGYSGIRPSQTIIKFIGDDVECVKQVYLD